MTIRKTLSNLVKSFARDQKGTIAVMYALSAVPLLLASGAAIDFVRYNAARTHLQASLDAGALAAAATSISGTTDADRKKAAEDVFEANMSSGAAAGLPLEINFEVNNGKVTSSASVEVPTSFMSLVGIDKLTAIGDAEVGLASDKKAEVVLVLDYSGSMSEISGGAVKYEAMRNAAKNLVNDLSASDADKVKFGLVPFSHHVYTTLPKAYVRGTTGSGSWTGCTQDRQYPYNISTSTPTSVVGSKWNQPMAPEHAAWGCQGYIDNNLRTVSLTNNFASVSGQLDIMKPYAWTHIALGVEFGYHMLSPEAPFTEGVAFNDSGTKKFMVVLTDGMQTEPAFGPGGSRNVSNGEKNLQSLCTSAKANGITMITLAFDLDDSGTRKALEKCSSDPAKNFFVANDSTDLAAAFDAIKTAIASQVFLSK